jgi:S1-C subfamily serine protease
VVADSETLNSQIAISGDSLFGSVIISILTWGAAAFAAGLLAGIPAAKPRVLAVLLVIMTLFKALQLVVVWAGTSFLDWTLPNRVGEVASLELRAGFYASCALAAAALAIAIFGLVGREAASKQVSIRPLALVPSAALVVATVAMGFFFKPQETRGEIAVESTTTSTLATTTTTSTTVAFPTTTTVATTVQGSQSSDSDVVLSTAFVVSAAQEDYICVRGSGAVVGNGSYVITNEHVVSTEDLPPECGNLWVGFGDDPAAEPDSWFAAEVLWSDYDLDLAILSLEDLGVGETRPLDIHYDQLKLGDEISVFGFPTKGGDTLTLTKGIISGFDNVEGYYKVSAVLNPGNSGGPVLDSRGRLVGIATAVAQAKVRCEQPDVCFTAETNLGLVRPINAARAAIREYVK